MNYLRRNLPLIAKGKFKNAMWDFEDLEEYLEIYWDAGIRHNRLFLQTKRLKIPHGHCSFMISPREAKSLLTELRRKK